VRTTAVGLVAALCAAGCGDDQHANVAIVSAQWGEALGEYAAQVPGGVVTFATGDGTLARDGDAFQIGVVDDAAMPAEGYRVDPVAGAGRTWIVHAHDVLGAQYGVTDALENLGFRFRHPYEPYVPAPPVPRGDALGVVHAPQVRVRGLQLHTLHPIEGYFAFWENDPDDAHRIIDWVVKNRGNFLQWVALNDIDDPARRAEWQAYTRDAIDYAHMRGIRIGIGVELFSQSNLQDAFTLVPNTAPAADQIAANLPLVANDLPWDVFALSFGEFFDADPQAFIDSVNTTAATVHAMAPAAELHADVHVGGTQLVTYMGQTMIYYFLVRFADPTVIPDIHTVMYFDLFESAGGAYQMADFSPHREYLLEKMCAHQPAAYFPENAYWIAFDDSVPQYDPLYVRSRLFDLQQLRAAAPPPCGPLDEHLLFSSGWEWGYWLHDTAALRASYELPDSQQALFEQQLAPDLGTGAADLVSELADDQHDALIGDGLAAYLASRDALIDAGRSIDVVSQPDRVTFDDLAGDTPVQRAQFEEAVMGPLAQYVQRLDALAFRAAALELPDSRWARELEDGFAIDRARGHFIDAAYRATLDHLAGDDAAAARDRASAASWMATGQGIVTRRHGDRHDPDPELVTADANHTVYAFGYLYMADTLCYWHRELDQVDAVLGNSTTTPPSCVYP
jgi:hypothetical protein